MYMYMYLIFEIKRCDVIVTLQVQASPSGVALTAWRQIRSHYWRVVVLVVV